MENKYEKLKRHIESDDKVIYQKGCKDGKFLVNYTLDKRTILEGEMYQFVVQVEYESDNGYSEIYTDSFNLNETDFNIFTKEEYSLTLYNLADNVIQKEIKRLEIVNQMFKNNNKTMREGI